MPRTEPPTAPESGSRDAATGGLGSVWPWALVAFVLAAGTGAGMRFGLIYGWPAGLGYGDVRHAHSHLMYFGWVTPALFALIGASLARSGTALPGLRPLLVGTLVVAFASYPAFLASGYRSNTWFGLELPWSMMTAGLNGVAWLVFLGLYARASLRPGARSDERARTVGGWFDAASFLLAASLVGIAGLAGTASGGLARPQTTAALVDLFLTWFGEGWFAAAVVGIAVGSLWGHSRTHSGGAGLRLAALVFATGMIVRGMSTFVLEIASGGDRAVTTTIRVATVGVSAGHVLVGLALAAAVLTLLRQSPWREAPTRLWTPALVFLLSKGFVEIGFAVPAVREVVGHANVRVLLLHAFLLGGISLAVVAAAAGRDRITRRFAWVFVWAVLVLLAGLLPLSGIFPSALRGMGALQLAAWTSLAPVAAAIALLSRAFARTPAGGSP